MKRHVVGLFAALVLGSVALGSAVSASHGVPIQGTFDTSAEFLGPGPCQTCITLRVLGTGQISHMGQAMNDGIVTIDFATGSQSGEATLTAADGSTLVLRFLGIFTPAGPNGEGVFSGTWLAISGTGRFTGEGASGNFSGDTNGVTGTLTFDGTLTNPGRN